jgi:hypothetical protein|tara:strand:- start:28 stop:603 length:576 start_codon:yes stop_codon:yes gene_type:complete
MRGKRGQFYLIAAIFIILIMFGTTSIATQASVKPEPRTIKDLGDELNRETYKIIEHGVVKDTNLTELIESFSGKDMGEYILKNSEDASIVFVYGNKDDYNAIAIANEGIGKITIGNTGGFKSEVHRGKRQEPKKEGDFLELKVNDTLYKFKIKPNEMFYFLIVKYRVDEVFIERNKEDESKEKDRPGGAPR